MITLPIPRIPPLASDEWTEEVRDVFTIIEGPSVRESGSKFNIIRTLANHPELATAWLNYYKVLLGSSTLTLRLREIFTLRVALRFESEYEWVQHVKLGRKAGLTDEHFEAIKQGAEVPIWSDLERLTIRAVDQLANQSQIDDVTWNGLATYLNKKELIELLFMIGAYTTLCWTFNAIGLQLEEDGSAANTASHTK